MAPIRALAQFWVAIIVLAAGGAGLLQLLGPPPAHEAPTGLTPAKRPARAPRPPIARSAILPRQVARPIPPPDPALLEPAPHAAGELLPRIGPDGRTSIAAYAGSFAIADPRPRIGVVVAGIGLSTEESKDAIDDLPAAVTLAFSPYAPNPDALLGDARAKGHELLVSLPLEPSGYPLNGTGDESLLVGAPPGQNRARLDWALGRFAGYVGATGEMNGMAGGRFSAEAALLTTLERRLAARGLLYIDARPGKPDPQAVIGRTVDVTIDHPAVASVIKANLEKLERIARLRGSALGVVGWPGPRTLRTLIAWITTLPASGLVLAPVTALARTPAPMEAAR